MFEIPPPILSRPVSELSEGSAILFEAAAPPKQPSPGLVHIYGVEGAPLEDRHRLKFYPPILWMTRACRTRAPLPPPG